MAFFIPAAIPLIPGDKPVALQVWLGRLNDNLVGVLTDPPRTMRGAPLTDISARNFHLSGMFKILIDDRLRPITGLEPKEVVNTVSSDMQDSTFQTADIVADGQSIPASTVTYRGLDFAFSRNYREHPVVLIKEAGKGLWPNVETAAEVP